MYRSVTISRADLICRILISGNLDSASGCLKGELVLTITPDGTQNQLFFCYPIAQIWISFLPCTVFTAHIYVGKSSVWNLWGAEGRAGANHNTYNAPRVSFYYRIQSICCYASETMALEAEGRHYGDLGVAVGTIGFQNDNLWCRQGQQGCRVDDLLFMVWFIWIVK